MPVSTSVHIGHCLQRILHLRPQSVLDVGCGFGLWGFLCREYLDVWNGRVQPSEWKTRIDGIELFEPYIQAHQRALYDHIYIRDIREAVDEIGKYDLIIAGDVIEHLNKKEGEVVLDKLYEKARQVLLINIPLGTGWDHPEQYGNPGELHRSQWEEEDLDQFPAERTGFEMPCGSYGVFWCPKDCEVDYRIQGLQLASERREIIGDVDSAIRYLEQARVLDPGRESTVAPLVDLYLRNNATEESIALLKEALSVNPENTYMRLIRARLLVIAQRNEEAREELDRILSGKLPIPMRIQSQANDLRAKLAGKN